MKGVRDVIEIIRQRVNSGGVVRLQGLRGSSPAMAVGRLAASGLKPIVVLVKSPSRAELWGRDLRFLCSPQTQVEVFPCWEVLPFERTSPYLRIQSTRLQLLRRLLMGEPPDILLVPVEAWMTRVIPRFWLEAQSIFLAPGKPMSPEELVSSLDGWGYQRVPLVEEPGDFSVRGGIVDCFPPEVEEPVRIDFSGDEIESLRVFSPDTQRSKGRLNWVELSPVKELPWSAQERASALRRITPALPQRQPPGLTSVLEGISEGVPFPGMEFLLPFFHEQLEGLWDYLPPGALLVLEDPDALEEELEGFWGRVKAREFNEDFPLASLVAAESLYVLPGEARRSWTQRARLSIQPMVQDSPQDPEVTSLTMTTSGHEGLRAELLGAAAGANPLGALAGCFGKWLEQGFQVHWVMRSSGQADRMREHLSGMGIPCRLDCPQGEWPMGPPRVWVRVAELSKGFSWPALGLVLLTEEEVFGPQRFSAIPRRARKSASLTHLEDLREGDLVVHVEHGIGIYRGLVTMETGGLKGDFLQLEYLGGDRLYVPVERFQSVHQYVGSEGVLPKLDRLGGPGWERRRRRVQRAVERMAKELLELYALREVTRGHAFSPPDSLYEEFCRGFSYQETPDQQRAIEEVMEDMGLPRPMDRLVCGDVGFGKTEVAMRAAFRAVMDSKQVAYLVPTTLLAEQQYKGFLERFRGYPVVIEVLSRFRTPGEQRCVLERCAKGEVDILIGTHRLLQRDVSFKDLGLIILDEEHRFGVAQKEKLKRLRKEVDVLTLTATPIPRTLHMALLGIRDLSIIQTPPPERLSIRTVVAPFEERVVREAVQRELGREGQVFFVHNRVQGMESIVGTLREWLPEVRMGVAHGQMSERELAKVMDRFHRKEIQMLVSTTIIEAGLDIPTANTILIHDAHKLGLAEMHQIRGRVGRSGHQAYAYLLLPRKTSSLSQEALQRIQSLQEFSELGAGFRIATRDLEIRGAGTLLGPSQSGHIEAVGFELYSQLMRRAVSSLKGEPVSVQIEPEVQLPVHARIPDEYVCDPHQRLALYRRVSRCEADEELDSLREELEDRYGPLPQETENLIELMGLRNLLRVLGIRRLGLQDGKLRVTFDPTTPVSPQRIVELAHSGREPGFGLVSEDTVEVPLDGACLDRSLVTAARDRLKALFLDASIAA
ncbi:MAG: transcription-repair coupling factor [Thermodesulfobacteriota bacterium]